MEEIKTKKGEHLAIPEGTRELVIRYDEPQKVYENRKVGVIGTIGTVVEFLNKRKSTIDLLQCHVLVNREKMNIALVVDEHANINFSDRIEGQLILTEDFKEWEINTGNYWKHDELADFIRMHRTLFPSISDAMKAAAALKDIKVVVNKEIEKQSEAKGDYLVQLKNKVVSSTIPSSIRLELPIFKGYARVQVEVELFVNTDNYTIALQSPEAKDIIATLKGAAIDEQLTQIRTLAPELAIYEI